MAAYLGCLPVDSPPSAKALDATRKPAWTSGFWSYTVPEGMHYQGRRWGGSQVSNIPAPRPTLLKTPKFSFLRLRAPCSSGLRLRPHLCFLWHAFLHVGGDPGPAPGRRTGEPQGLSLGALVGL